MSELSGLDLFKDFISEEEEAELLSQFSAGKKKRRTGRSSIKRYGTPVYRNDIIGDLPDWGIELCNKLVSTGVLFEVPDHTTLNEYQPQASIAAHVDNKASGPVITVLSLGSEATMVMTKGKNKIEVELPSRSVLRMSGDARWEWKHEILPVKSLRYSLVFRKLTE